MCSAIADVRFGPIADIRAAKRHVRFIPESGRFLVRTAMRAAAFELQQADELARPFAKSNTKRPIGPTGPQLSTSALFSFWSA